MRRFKIWYDTFEVEGDTIEDWQNAPAEGVVAIYEFFGFQNGFTTGRINSGSDWYWMDENGTIDHCLSTEDQPGVWVDFTIPPNCIAKKGLWVSDERMSQVDQEILKICAMREQDA